jgi:hypothetical protein
VIFSKEKTKGKLKIAVRPALAKRILANLAGGVLEDNVGNYRRVGFVRHVGAKADADIKRSVKVEVHGGADLVHRFAF